MLAVTVIRVLITVFLLKMVRGEAGQAQVKKSRDWLQANIAVEGAKVIAVTSPNFSSYNWKKERVNITASKTDYLFILESLASSLPNQQPRKVQSSSV